MRARGKRLLQCNSRRSSSLQREIQSKINSSSQKKNHHKISYTKKCKLKSISYARARGTRKSILTRKQKQHADENHNCMSYKDQSSMKFSGKKHHDLSHRVNEESSCHDGGNTKQKRRRHKDKEHVVQDEASRLQKRTRYLLIKIKLEQNLIDAYSGEGWKGQSREKIKPEKELERAQSQILKCKLGIRDAIHQLDMLSREGCIDESVMFPDGSVFHEHIFCAICKSCEAFEDNDIILCDGPCNCAFHQKCLEPPLTKIPPGDQGWLCKFCVCKVEILESVNAHLGTSFSMNSNWEDIFKEAALGPVAENNYLDPAHEWPSEDSEDADYDPERSDKGFSRANPDIYMSDNANGCSSSPCSSDQASYLSGVSLDYDRSNLLNLDFIPDHDDTGMLENKNSQRQRRDVDYRKLHDEMFGKELLENEQQSEDEDWGPHKRKRKCVKSDVATSLTSNSEKDTSLKLLSAKRIIEKQDSVLQSRKSVFRIPPNALEKLRQVFAENELPSRVVKENLSKQLGIAVEKVSKWFKNARYAALRVKKEENMIQSNNFTQRSHINFQTSRSSKDHILASSPGTCVDRNIMLLGKSSDTRKNLLEKEQCRAAKGHSDIIEASMQIRRKLSSQSKNSSAKGRNEANDQLYLVELERLYNLEDRVEKLKDALGECRENCNTSNETHTSGPLVVYVPVIELKEKEQFSTIHRAHFNSLKD